MKPNTPPAWVRLPLNQLTTEQWEALCDGCGKCCLHKYYADEEDKAMIAQNPHSRPEWRDHSYVYSQMACELYDVDANGCRDYANRQRRMPDCVQLSYEQLSQIDWLPDTCAYRLRYHDQPLPDWHPLISGTTTSVADAGVAVSNWAVSFNHREDPLDYLLDFIP